MIHFIAKTEPISSWIFSALLSDANRPMGLLTFPTVLLSSSESFNIGTGLRLLNSFYPFFCLPRTNTRGKCWANIINVDRNLAKCYQQNSFFRRLIIYIADHIDYI